MRQRVYPKQANKFRPPLWLIWGGMVGAAFGVGWGAYLVIAAPARRVSQSPCSSQQQFVAAALSAIAGEQHPCATSLVMEPLASQPLQSATVAAHSLDFLVIARDYDQLRYTATAQPPFRTSSLPGQSPSLDEIMAGILNLLVQHNQPTAAVSISLVDLTDHCCDYGHYQDQQRRYPASVVKLFWLVALYGQYDAGDLQPEVDLIADDEALMAHYSNNGASSRVLDVLTQTTSGESLDDTSLAEWSTARNTVNEYFTLANYGDVNLAHKTFPIPDLALDQRTGRDLQLAIGAAATAVPTLTERNYLTTRDTARLLYEIETGQAISPAYSDRIKAHLQHSTDPAVWQADSANAIEGFLGEYLPPDTQLHTKLGFTFDDGRQEAAIIATPDGQTRFILVVFANDAVYSADTEIFPKVGRYVYDQMQRRQASQTSP
ncbi:MAG: serine hydrolase [Cyanobacteria bacterium P01_D01_bin.115]